MWGICGDAGKGASLASDALRGGTMELRRRRQSHSLGAVAVHVDVARAVVLRDREPETVVGCERPLSLVPCGLTAGFRGLTTAGQAAQAWELCRRGCGRAHVPASARVCIRRCAGAPRGRRGGRQGCRTGAITWCRDGRGYEGGRGRSVRREREEEEV